MRKISCALMLTVSALSYAQIPGLEPEKAWDLNGYIKYMLTSNFTENSDDTQDHLIHQRFNYEYRFSPALRFNAGMRNRLIWGNSAEVSGYSEVIEQDSGYMDLSGNWQKGENSVGNSQFDRLYIHWEKDTYKFRAGRFRINWGMTTVWNPNDVFNSYSIYDFDYEERPGTDALSASKELGFASQVDLVFAPTDEQGSDSYALRYLFNYLYWDIQLIGGCSMNDYFAGAGFAGDIEGAGVRGEISIFEPEHDTWQETNQSSVTIASLETDYSFGGDRNWMVRGAVLYTSTPQDSVSAEVYLSQPLTAKTLSFTEYSFYADVSFTSSALNSIALSTIYYQDGSVFFSGTDTYSLSDDWQLVLVIQNYTGDNKSLFGENSNTSLFGQIRMDF